MSNLDKSNFDRMGETLLLMAEGNRQIAAALAGSVTANMRKIRQWTTKSSRPNPTSASSPT